MTGNEKPFGAIAVAGGLLILGSTAVACTAEDGQTGSGAASTRPVSVEQSDAPTKGTDDDRPQTGPGDHYTGPAPDEIYTGPEPRWAHAGNPWPEHCSTADPSVDAERAKRIALQEVPGASVTQVDLDRCYGMDWELELREDSTEYEIEIDADNGEIVSVEEDVDD
ncbi:hypothetical protein GCM10009854_15210 [Saccharopolyspora halophila]|uniref:PepSY domain-containing protein n=1 Tax=Saccharopolyspora halophila TaxID=405551 RepID=A0ABN3FXF3_9PSEU